MNTLLVEFLRIGIKPEQIANTISPVLGCSERTIRNKLNGRSEFTLSEAIKIKETWFSTLSLDYLFNEKKNIKQNAN